jgi:uncharacterized protein (TIGR02246 family)
VIPLSKQAAPAMTSEDLTRLFVDRANAHDAAGMAELYAEDAVMAWPPGELTTGRAAIRAVFEELVRQIPERPQEQPLQTLVAGDLAFTSTPAAGGGGVRAQVARRQPDGSWLRVLDRPQFDQ